MTRMRTTINAMMERLNLLIHGTEVEVLPTISAAHHPGGRHRLGLWTRHANARARVNDRDRITDAGRSWLMQLQRCRLTLVRRNIRVRVGVEGEAGIGSYLMRLWA